jgi:hypothetical protein
MALNVTVDLPQYEGMGPIGIVGVGVVENGGSLSLDEGQEAAFYATNGYPLQDAGQEGVDVSGSPDYTPPEPPPEVTPTQEEVTPDEQPTVITSGLPQGDQGGEA